MKYPYVLAALMTIPSAAAFAMPRGSFLMAPAPTRAALIKALKESSTAACYRKATDQSPGTLVATFMHLRSIRLQHDRVVGVWFVTHGRKAVYWRLRRLRAGTRVWVTPHGQAFLIGVCGNPVRHPPTPLPPVTAVPPFPPQQAPPLLQTPPGEAPPDIDLSPPPLAWQPPLEDLPPAEMMGPPPIEIPPVVGVPPNVDLSPPDFNYGPPIGEMPPWNTPHKKGFPWWDVFWLAPIGLLFIHGGHGTPDTSSSSPLPPPTVTPPEVTPPVTSLPVVTPPVVTRPITTPPVVIPPIVSPPLGGSPTGTPPFTLPPPVTGRTTTTPEAGGMATMTLGVVTIVGACWRARRKR